MQHVSAISLFVEDLVAAKAFYLKVFEVPVIYEDANSVAVKFDKLIINLLQLESAQEIVAPGKVAPAGIGSRVQFSIWTDDVDAACERLRELGVTLTGPKDRPWGKRTANFVDPAGHSWEIAQAQT
jgi:catechol 2,3-dioxygenase-like lactoylglutathione lyase family enzyme